jgi:hypothetical protein
MICGVDGCDRPRHAWGYCAMHGLRVYRNGTTVPKRGGTIEQRFWRNVVRGEPDECWAWKVKGSKYGQFRHFGGRMEGAHRVSYRLSCGEIPDGMLVLHKCDNPGCVNPDHLRLGTPKENMADMDAKGRRVARGARGEKSALAILNEHAVRFIRSSDLNNSELGRIFGLTPNAIRAVRTRKSWAHVT